MPLAARTVRTFGKNEKYEMKLDVRIKLGKSAFLIALAVNSVPALASDCASNYSSRMGSEALEVCAASLQPSDLGQSVILGDIFFYGRGPKPDKQRAISYYTRAAAAGHSEAQWKLAQALKSLDAPPEVWLGWIEKSAMTRNGDALDALASGDWRTDESKDPKDRRLSELNLQALIRVATLAKLDDDRYAQVTSRIGYMYDKGVGAAPNRQEAVTWFIRAGERGGYKALWFALKTYKLGDGIPKNSVRAEQLLALFFDKQKDFFASNSKAYIDWLTQAADLGFSSAALRLADIYDKGAHGVVPSSDTAARLRKQARD